MEIAQGIYFYQGRDGGKIRPGAGSCNVTIVKGGGLSMIDTGLTAGGAFRALKAKARADGLDLSDVLWILHTHCHWDHINADGAVLSSCNARIAAGEEDAPFIENREKNFSGGVRGFGDLTPEIFPYPLSWVRLLRWVSWGSQPALRVDRSLADGETVDMGRKIEVLSSAGPHSRPYGILRSRCRCSGPRRPDRL